MPTFISRSNTELTSILYMNNKTIIFRQYRQDDACSTSALPIRSWHRHDSKAMGGMCCSENGPTMRVYWGYDYSANPTLKQKTITCLNWTKLVDIDIDSYWVGICNAISFQCHEYTTQVPCAPPNVVMLLHVTQKIPQPFDPTRVSYQPWVQAHIHHLASLFEYSDKNSVKSLAYT